MISNPKAPLCCGCDRFMPVPFTVGNCQRRLQIEDPYPRITAEREFPDDNVERCGPGGRYFIARAKEVAA